MYVTSLPAHFTPDQELLETIELAIHKLEKFFDNLSDAQVTLKLDINFPEKKIAEIKLITADSVFFVRECQQTFEASVIAAATSLKRQLVRYRDSISRKES